jgi:hypothetical protein
MDHPNYDTYDIYDNYFDYEAYQRDIQTFMSDGNSNSNNNDEGLINNFSADTYYCNQCLDPSGNQPNWHIYSKRCNRCNGCSDGLPGTATQRRIQNTVRVSQSEYLENLAGLNVFTPAIAKYGFVNWNQGSDRAEPGRVQRNVPSHNANSTKTSVTRMRPGSCSAAGQGVDIKHGSYARYLARIKGRGPYRTQLVPAPVPLEGNKTRKYGISNSYSENKCTCPTN